MANERVQGAIDKTNDTVNNTFGSNSVLGRLDASTKKFRTSRGSIISSAKGNVFEFPVFISSSIPLDYATATNALLEQVYASYLQMAITLNPVIDHNLASSGLQFSHLKSDTGKYLEYTDTSWQHEACHNEIISESGVQYEFNMITVDDSDMKAIVEYVNHQPLSEFDHFFTEAKRMTKAELEEKGKRLEKLEKEHTKAINALHKSQGSFDTASKRMDELNERLKTANAKEKENLKKEIENLKKQQEFEKKEASLKSTAVKAPKFIGEKEMEKLNTLRPLLMTVDLNVKADDGHLSPVQYVVGAKTFCRLIDADTIPEVAEYPLKEMNKVVRKAKWRAGELKFFSDIVFRIKQKKQTAADSRDPKRKWYRRLYELAHMKGDAPTTDIVKGNSIIASFILDKMGKPRSAHGVIPNCTLVISKTDVDICKTQTGIDLLNGHTAAKLCDELFLIGLVIIDTDQESVKILLPDLHNDFDVHSIASVNHQIAQLDLGALKLKESRGSLR